VIISALIAGLDPLRRFFVFHEPEVYLQFGAVKPQPLPDQPQCPWRDRTSQDLSGGNRDLHFLSGIEGVEMRWWVVFEIHLDHDPVEAADPGHG
jgi:hypothetical protein